MSGEICIGRPGINVRFNSSSSWLKDSRYTIKQQSLLYDAVLQDVINHTRWYLDQLDYLSEFKVSWADYRKPGITKPYKYVDNTKNGGNRQKKFQKPKPL